MAKPADFDDVWVGKVLVFGRNKPRERRKTRFSLFAYLLPPIVVISFLSKKLLFRKK